MIDDVRAINVGDEGTDLSVQLWSRRPRVLTILPVFPGANLVDARTGQVIASNPNLSTAVGAGQGVLGAALDPAFGEPIDRFAGNLATSYRNWLVAS